MGGAAPARAAGAAEAAALAAAYVGAIYAARALGALAAAAAARGAPPQPPPPPRDDPREIARRARAVSGAAAAVAVYTRLRCGPEPLARINGGEAASGIALLRGGALAVAATSALFLGPTVQAWLDGVTPASAVHALWHRLRSPSGMRDLLVAPVTEEVVFRGGACAVMARAGWSRAAVTYLSPLGFGVAHLHHLIEARRRGVPLARAVLSAAAQLSYTTVFGWCERATQAREHTPSRNRLPLLLRKRA